MPTVQYVKRSNTSGLALPGLDFTPPPPPVRKIARLFQPGTEGKIEMVFQMKLSGNINAYPAPENALDRKQFPLVTSGGGLFSSCSGAFPSFSSWVPAICNTRRRHLPARRWAVALVSHPLPFRWVIFVPRCASPARWSRSAPRSFERPVSWAAVEMLIEAVAAHTITAPVVTPTSP